MTDEYGRCPPCAAGDHANCVITKEPRDPEETCGCSCDPYDLGLEGEDF